MHEHIVRVSKRVKMQKKKKKKKKKKKSPVVERLCSTPIEKLEDLKSPFNHFAQIRAIFNIFRLCKTETVLLQCLIFQERGFLEK